jgi:cytochrome c
MWLICAAMMLSVVAFASPQPARAGAANPVRGERVFQYCFSCHSVDPSETSKLQGPTLYRIVGRPAGSVPGFEYSEPMKAQAARGLVWTTEMLDRYVMDADSVVPGTRMNFPGVKDDQDRADLIAYLARSGTGKPW